MITRVLDDIAQRVPLPCGMSKHLYLLTGASRGMGLAMAEQLLCVDHFVVGVSRHTNDALALRAAQLGSELAQWPVDLQDSVTAAALLEKWLRSCTSDSFASATLINNAGVIPQICPLSASDPVDLSRALRVGLETPMMLAAAFLRVTEFWGIPRKVLNISSGLGRRAMASQSSYCAAKAGMDHFTRCLALEEGLKPHGAKVCSLAPGVIDTDMQVQLRNAVATAFPDQDRFIDLKASGQLASPADAANRVLSYLARSDFGDNPTDDVRD